MDDKDLGELRFKVNGDLSRFEEMVSIMLRMSKAELAISDQRSGFRMTGGAHWVEDENFGWLYYEDGTYFDSYGYEIGDDEAYYDFDDEYDYDLDDEYDYDLDYDDDITAYYDDYGYE